jgi:HSP20 family protein
MFQAMVPWTGRLPPPLFRFEDEMNRLMNRFFREEDGSVAIDPFVPRTNVAETDSAIEVTVELPGMKAEDFMLEIHDDDLWITGEKKEEKEEKRKTFHRMERHHGMFRRIVPLAAPVNAAKAEATYRDGVLRVALEKVEKVKPKAIPVKV